MFFGIWRRAVERTIPGLPAGSVRVNIASGCLTASGSGRLRRTGQTAVAWLNAEVPPDEAEGTGPTLRLTGDALEVSAGALPQYPLYYVEAPDFFAACTDLSLLLGVAPSGGVDISRVVGLLASHFDAGGGATAFRGIRRLRACESVRADHEGVRSSLRLPRAERRAGCRAEDLAVEMRDRLDTAVARAVRGARRVAVYVSGGLDSSGILALTLARHRGGGPAEVLAISEIWSSPGDDGPYLSILERSLGIAALRIPVSDAGHWFLQSLCADAQPQVFPAACGDMSLWSAGIAHGADASLSGHGGDTVCGGMLPFADQVLSGRPIRAVRDALNLEVPPDRDLSRLRRLERWVIRPTVSRALQRVALQGHVARWRHHRIPWLTNKFHEELAPILAHEVQPAPRTPDERLAALCQSPFLAELCVSWGQIASVAGGGPIDVFRELDFVRFVAGIEPSMLFHGGKHRGLYRLAMKDLLPEAVRLRKDKALGPPLTAQAALSANAWEALRQLSSLDRVASLGLVEPDAFRPTFDMWLKWLMQGGLSLPESMASSQEVWSFLAVEQFLRRHAGSTAAINETTVAR